MSHPRRDLLARLSPLLAVAFASFAACGDSPGAAHPGPAAALPPVADGDLRAPAAFAAIGDTKQRSQALFVEATRVMLHPRCKNCHPAGDSPTQGDDGAVHDPPVQRGPDDHGIAALTCTGCHQDRNLELARVPGAPKWAVAPKVMAWQGKSVHAVCEQLKDKARNGNKTLAQIVEHSGHDELVAWGWQPGHGRTKAPGTQQQFGEIMAAWVDTGAVCPPEEAKR